MLVVRHVAAFGLGVVVLALSLALLGAQTLVERVSEKGGGPS